MGFNGVSYGAPNVVELRGFESMSPETWKQRSINHPIPSGTINTYIYIQGGAPYLARLVCKSNN